MKKHETILKKELYVLMILLQITLNACSTINIMFRLLFYKKYAEKIIRYKKRIHLQ